MQALASLDLTRVVGACKVQAGQPCRSLWSASTKPKRMESGFGGLGSLNSCCYRAIVCTKGQLEILCEEAG